MLYGIAKSLSSEGAVTIDRFEYLLIGLIPFIAALLLERRSLEPIWKLTELWVASLFVFIAFSALFWFESIRLAIRNGLGIDNIYVYAGICSLMSVGIATLALCAISSLRSQKLAGPPALGRSFFGNVVLFFVLIFLVPASF